MNGITVSMAIVDLVPVILFFIAAVFLQRDLYNKMSKGAFALLATGSYMVLISGVYKALWKVLYALNVCDYPVLSDSFFAMQAPGFLFVFIALIALFTKSNKKGVTLMGVGVVPVFSSNLPFIAMQTLGCAGMQWCLVAVSKKMKKPLAAVLFILSFVTMLCMGYLSAKFDDTAGMHWVAQLTNIVSQGALLGGVWLLHRAGLNKADALDR